MYCYKHTKVETAVSCGKCERAICVKCMVSGPAGMRCPDCASLRGTHLYKVSPQHVILQAVIGLGAGAVGVALVNMIGWLILVIFLSTMYGGAVGELMLRAINRKHGTLVEVLGTSTFVVGGFIPLVFEVVSLHTFLVLKDDWLSLIALGIAAAACYSRLKYY